MLYWIAPQFVTCSLLISQAMGVASPGAPATDLPRALEVMRSMQAQFYNRKSNSYNDPARAKGKPPAMWACGVALSADIAAARQMPSIYKPVVWASFNSMDHYWDWKQTLGGYEPYPTGGDGHDKYYDDNEWIAIALIEGFQTTGRSEMLERAAKVVDFVASGWDDTLGGGIWWHERHKGNGKNTCSNAPAAVAFLRLAMVSPARAIELRKMAQRTVDWTIAHLQRDDGRFADGITTDGVVHKFSLTYNTALMIRAELLLYRATGDRADLEAAERMERSADAFVDSRSGRYHDQVRWSHLLVEADLAIYRQDKNPDWLRRARAAVDADYTAWKASPSDQLIDVASLARELWLLNESHTYEGIAFWRRADGPLGVTQTVK
jgi:hypothetical protein